MRLAGRVFLAVGLLSVGANVSLARAATPDPPDVSISALKTYDVSSVPAPQPLRYEVASQRTVILDHFVVPDVASTYRLVREPDRFKVSKKHPRAQTKARARKGKVVFQGRD